MSDDFEEFVETESKKKTNKTKQIRIDLETYDILKDLSEKYNLKLIRLVNYAVKNLSKELNPKKNTGGD